MENLELYYYFSGILNALGKIILTIACFVLFVRQKNSATTIMLIGSVLTIVFGLAGLLWTTLSAQMGPQSLAKTNGIITILGQLPYILFTIGLLLFAFNHAKKKV
ncbi:MAG: hypothetical protein R2819_00500 [Allomuricauda sp.]